MTRRNMTWFGLFGLPVFLAALYEFLVIGCGWGPAHQNMVTTVRRWLSS